MKRYMLILAAVGLTTFFLRDASAQADDPIVVDSAIVRLIEQVEAPARAPGDLVSLQVAEGDVVEEGALLAAIDREEADLLHARALADLEISKDRATDDVAIRAAKDALEFAQGELKRVEQAHLRLPGSISLSELEEAKLHVSQAALQIERSQREQRQWQLQAELKLRDVQLSQHGIDIRRVTAPVPGVVVEILRHKGEWVEPGDTVLRILRINRLRAEGLVPIEALRPDLQGAAVTVVVAVPGRPDIECTGQVAFVSPEVNAVNGQVRVWAEFDNPDGVVRPGLRATMTIHP